VQIGFAYRLDKQGLCPPVGPRLTGGSAADEVLEQI
jgi:hypothetical protein